VTRRIAAGLLSVAFVLAGLAIAQDPPGGDDPPVRLKKKHHPDAADKGPEEPPKPAEPPKDSPKPKDEKKDPKEADPGAADEPEVDEAEVLNRVGKNMRTSEDRLDHAELNDGTRQVQEDIIKDLDSLINQMKNGGAEDQNQQQNPQDQQQQDQGGKPQSGEKKQGQSGKQQVGMGKPQRGLRGQRRQAQAAATNPGAPNRKPGMSGPQQQQANADKPSGRQQQQQANNPNNQGGGGGQSQGPVNRLDEMYKDVWGHLPETMRAEMNAYSREQFMAKYNDLIKQYYSTVAEKSRKKE
jgi:hypothetical protein